MTLPDNRPLEVTDVSALAVWAVVWAAQVAWAFENPPSRLPYQWSVPLLRIPGQRAMIPIHWGHWCRRKSPTL